MDNVFGENIPTDWTAFYQEWLFNSVQKQLVAPTACELRRGLPLKK
jgi:hypothetical protein